MKKSKKEIAKEKWNLQQQQKVDCLFLLFYFFHHLAFLETRRSGLGEGRKG